MLSNSTVYKISAEVENLQQDFREHVGSGMRFVVRGDFNSKAALVRQEVKNIESASTIEEQVLNVRRLVIALGSTEHIKQVSFELVPIPSKALCEVRVYPVINSPGFGLWPFEQRGFGLYRTNTFKFDAEFFNKLNHFETIEVGHRYGFDFHKDKLFGNVVHRLGSDLSMKFSASTISRNLSDSVKENSVKGDLRLGGSIANSALTWSGGLSLKERHNVSKKYDQPEDLMRTQLYSLHMQLKRAGNAIDSDKLKAQLGYDPERQQHFFKLSGRFSRAHLLGKHEMVRFLTKFGTVLGQNVAANDKFSYRAAHSPISHHVSLRTTLYSQRHSLFRHFGVLPCTYAEGWLTSEQGSIRKELELGIGLYVKRLGLEINVGLMDVAENKISPSSRLAFRLN